MIIGVCGYGYTGSGAVIDLLREYQEISYKTVNNRICEFTLPYEPDGLLDLEYHLTSAPVKHLKGDVAIRRFIQLTNWQARSMNRISDGHFSELTNAYLESIIQVRYKCHTNYRARNNRAVMFYDKVIGNLQRRLEMRVKRFVPLLKQDNRYISVNPDGFQEKTREYISAIINAMGFDSKKDKVLLDQPFSPNNPSAVFHFFTDPKAIVVNRDPRDVYLIAKHLVFSPARFIPHDSPEDFVSYYRAVAQCTEDDDVHRVLRIQYEDLVYNYDCTVRRIEEFLGVEKHIFPLKYFDPSKSIKNTQMMSVFPEDKAAIEYIERELQEFLFPFEQYSSDIDHSELIRIANQ